MSKRSRIVRRRMRAHENRKRLWDAYRHAFRGMATHSIAVKKSLEELRQMFRDLYPDGGQLVTVDGTKGVVSSQAFKFDNGAPGQPVIMEEADYGHMFGSPLTVIHDIEIKSASLDGMNFLYHPQSPNP